jgi:hypothetical protein
MKKILYSAFLLIISFQLVNAQVSLSDIGNAEKARLVAQCDIKDGVSKIINFEFDVND